MHVKCESSRVEVSRNTAVRNTIGRPCDVRQRTKNGSSAQGSHQSKLPKHELHRGAQVEQWRSLTKTGRRLHGFPSRLFQWFCSSYICRHFFAVVLESSQKATGTKLDVDTEPAGPSI